MNKATFHPVVTVTDNGDGTADVEFDWEGSIHPDHMDEDTADDARLSHAMDSWKGKGRPDAFTITIPRDKKVVEKPPPKPTV